MEKVFALGIGGFIGANARYWLDQLITSRAPHGFPWGTIIINITGSFLLGLFASIFIKYTQTPFIRLVLTTGFLGAYTTFSTFEYETLQLMNHGSFVNAFLNCAISLFLGLFAVWVGSIIGKMF